MYRVIRILTADGVHDSMKFPSPLVLDCILNVQYDNKGDDILMYSDSICVEAGRFGSELLNICYNLLLEVVCHAKDVL